jgi:bisphosphoglycerate-independent phosphoglycerate mutase (AlkP superfamily)
MNGAVAALERVDRFLGGVLSALPADVTLLLASDHGNVEDVTREHTRNPSLGLAAGPGARRLAEGMLSIQDVTPAALALLGVRG